MSISAKPVAKLIPTSVAEDLLAFAAGRKFRTILADPPWQFQNRTGKVAPEHRRLSRYGTMTLEDIKTLPVSMLAADVCQMSADLKSQESSIDQSISPCAFERQVAHIT